MNRYRPLPVPMTDEHLSANNWCCSMGAHLLAAIRETGADRTPNQMDPETVRRWQRTLMILSGEVSRERLRLVAAATASLAASPDGFLPEPRIEADTQRPA